MKGIVVGVKAVEAKCGLGIFEVHLSTSCMR